MVVVDRRRCAKRLLAVVASLAAIATFAKHKEGQGTSFVYKNWELVCDNMRTCHAIGYHSNEANDTPVSIMLTRSAGPGAVVKAQINVGGDAFKGDPGKLESDTLKPGIVLPRIEEGQRQTIAAADVPKLIASILKDKTIAVISKDATAVLSLDGATAVLVKMDEYQGRIDTPGAITKKGKKSESSVLPPIAAPTVRIATAPATTKSDYALLKPIEKRLDLKSDQLECNKSSEKSIAVARLTTTQLLFSVSCGIGAYNYTTKNWIVRDKAPFDPQATANGEFDPRDSSVVETMKGRGVGDCIYKTQHHFDGTQFVLTRESGDSCKGFPGGAWGLQSYVTRLVR
jgi:hypothetical protein